MIGTPTMERLTRDRDTFLKDALYYVFLAITTSGPWLLAVLSLALLGSWLATFFNVESRAILFATITYAYTLSLAVAGGPQMLITRYLADRLYLSETHLIAPTCTGVLVSAAPISLLTLPFIAFAPFDLRYRLLAATLFVALTLIWLLMIFLSATRDYLRIFIIFSTSFAVSLGGAYWLGQRFGLIGGLAGFTLGQMTCLALLVANIYLKYAPAYGVNFAYLGYIRKYWDLLVIGFFSAAGIWIDNVLYWWFSPHGESVGGFYRLFPTYDSIKLVAFLATIPASAVFQAQLLRFFYPHYRAFYDNITNKRPLDSITTARNGMAFESQRSLIATLTVQSIIMLIGVLAASRVVVLMGISRQWIPLVQVLTVGVSAQFFMLNVFIFLLYLDLRRPTLFILGIFLGVNITLTIGTLVLGNPDYYGMGYLIAGVIAVALALVVFYNRLGQLEFLTFRGAVATLFESQRETKAGK